MRTMPLAFDASVLTVFAAVVSVDERNNPIEIK